MVAARAESINLLETALVTNTSAGSFVQARQRERPRRETCLDPCSFLLGFGKVRQSSFCAPHYGCQLGATIPCCDGSLPEPTMDPAPRPFDPGEYVAIGLMMS